MKLELHEIKDVLKLPNCPFANIQHLPNVSCIYFVVTTTNAPTIIYIGKAKSLLKRWQGHHRIPECSLLQHLGLEVSIYWQQLNNVSDEVLVNLEALMIETFNPPLNLTRTLTSKRRTAEFTPLVSDKEILNEYIGRLSQAKKLLISDEFWESCNMHEDGDLMHPWVLKDQSYTVDHIELYMMMDNHDLYPNRVSLPPAFDHPTNSPIKDLREPMEIHHIEKTRWLQKVARQIDSWLISIVRFHTSSHPKNSFVSIIKKIEKLESVSDFIRKELR